MSDPTKPIKEFIEADIANGQVQATDAALTGPTDYKAATVYWHERAMTAETDLAAANAELGALKREVLALGTGLIRVRQQIFPAHDQTAVIRRDFPIYAAIAAKERP